MSSQTLNGVLLPVILIVMLRLINDKKIMGKFANGRLLNIVNWVVVAVLIILTLLLILATLFPGIFAGLK